MTPFRSTGVIRIMTNRAVVALLAVVSTCAVALHAGQDPRPPQPTTFEAASIKPNTSGDPGISVRRQPGGRFNAINAPLRSLILLAHQLQGFQLVDAPDWVATDRFDIVAKIEGDPPPTPPGSPNDPMVLAVRALLAERFKLAVHRETRQMDIYALVMARPDGKPGRALRPTTQDCPVLMAAAARGGAPPAPPAGGPAVVCGIRTTPSGQVFGGGAEMSFLANGLAGQVGRIVVDRTGLTGGWDFEFQFAPEQRGPLPAGADTPPANPDAPSLFTALQEQLGLKLEATKGPVEVLVIDSVDRPTPD